VEFIFIDNTSTRAAMEPTAVECTEIFHQRLMAVRASEIMKMPAMKVLIKTGTGYLIIIYDVAA